MKAVYPLRINKYLALKQYCTRREADELIRARKVTINGKLAVLGDKVSETDSITVNFRPRKYRYFAYHKPRGIITHSAQEGEQEIMKGIPLEGVFPIGRLDKDSYGLIILTDDGRITDALLNPDRAHEKEYEVSTRDALLPSFKARMEAGVDIGGYRTRPCKVRLLGNRKFAITLTEGKKHQIRRMCGAFGASAVQLKRTRIMNVALGDLKPNEFRPIEGAELVSFIKSLGIRR